MSYNDRGFEVYVIFDVPVDGDDSVNGSLAIHEPRGATITKDLILEITEDTSSTYATLDVQMAIELRDGLTEFIERARP